MSKYTFFDLPADLILILLIFTGLLALILWSARKRQR